ncbi:MAG: type II toxin-antitoxin system VapC family toxin [Anaerolineales bacterium]|nr:type II toxin-antitoxin system VapC family toxin [Anaerolineales bacterium]
MIVLDTHVIIWDALAPERLSEPARAAIAQANQGDGLIICDISVWEIAMLLQKGRVQVQTDPLTFINLVLQANKVRVQPITPHIATLATQFPAQINQDPADRLIAATALAENATLVTADRNLQAASLIPTLW